MKIYSTRARLGQHILEGSHEIIYCFDGLDVRTREGGKCNGAIKTTRAFGFVSLGVRRYRELFGFAFLSQVCSAGHH